MLHSNMYATSRIAVKISCDPNNEYLVILYKAYNNNVKTDILLMSSYTNNVNFCAIQFYPLFYLGNIFTVYTPH